MRTETLELALHQWNEWHKSIEDARRNLDYAPESSVAEREVWWETNRSPLFEATRRALTHLSLPKSFALYWMACFISDYRRGKQLSLEKIRWPISWMKGTKFPIDPVPPGCWRIVVENRRYYRGDTVVNDPRLADTFRVFPPPLATLTIPKWLHAKGRVEATLEIDLLPREKWRQCWKNRERLPVLLDIGEETNFVASLTNPGKRGDSDQKRWEASATIQMPTWAVSDDLLGLVHEQLLAIRMWQDGLQIHPMSTLLKQAAASESRPRVEGPPQWYQWLQEYQDGGISYGTLVERVYRVRIKGNPRKSPPQQPPEAKKAADWVRKQLIGQGIPRGKLQRNWWRNMSVPAVVEEHGPAGNLR